MFLLHTKDTFYECQVRKHASVDDYFHPDRFITPCELILYDIQPRNHLGMVGDRVLIQCYREECQFVVRRPRGLPHNAWVKLSPIRSLVKPFARSIEMRVALLKRVRGACPSNLGKWLEDYLLNLYGIAALLRARVVSREWRNGISFSRFIEVLIHVIPSDNEALVVHR